MVSCLKFRYQTCIEHIQICCCKNHVMHKLPLTKICNVRLTSKRYSTEDTSNYMNVFDRAAKLCQKNRTADLPDYEVYDYLKEKVGCSLADRVLNINRKFDKAIDLGCGRGYVSRHITSQNIKELIMCDISQKYLDQAHLPENGVKVKKLVLDEEKLSFEDNSIDLVISCLSLHWVNDLPGAFARIISCLKSDGVFMAALFGGQTLYELRSSLHLAQMEREGGVSSHISPFTELRDIGSLLTRAGFNMLTIDVDEIVVGYPTMFELMWDLKGMGENNAARNRSAHLRRETMLSASAIYESMYGSNGKLPATFQIINFIGWKPDPSQPKPAKRGSANFSLKDMDKLNEIIKETQQTESSDESKK